MLFSWQVDERVGIVVFARWLCAMAKTAGRDFNGVCWSWQIFVRSVMRMSDTCTRSISPKSL